MDYRVDWASYGDAVREHARRETDKFSNLAVSNAVHATDNGISQPRLSEDPSKYSFRRAQGLALVILAVGVAIALLIWAIHLVFSNSTANSSSQSSTGHPVFTSRGQNNFFPQPTTPEQKGRTSNKTPEVVNFTRFAEHKLGDLLVVSGWRYANSRETRPAKQYCYVDLGDPNGGARRMPTIANDGRPISYDAQTMTPLTRDQYDHALSKCTWYKP